MGAKPRRNRPARSRREQALRAEARTVSRLLRGVAQLQAHRGSQPSRLGAALALALRAVPPDEVEGARLAESQASAKAAEVEEAPQVRSTLLRSSRP